MVTLVFKQGPRAGETCELTDARITFGRSPDAHVPLEDTRVSWDHAVLELVGGAYQVMDVGSSNGTFVGPGMDAVTVPRRLSSGDVIWVGDSEIGIHWGSSNSYKNAVRTATVLDADGSMSDQLSKALLNAEMQGQGGEHTVQLDVSEQFGLKDQVDEHISRRTDADYEDTMPTSVELSPSLEFAVSADMPAQTTLMEDVDNYQLNHLPPNLIVLPRLHFVTGPHRGRLVIVGLDGALVGRSKSAQVPLDDIIVADQHCRISLSGDRLELECLGASVVEVHGTETRGRVSLGHLDLVSIGTSVAEYFAPGKGPTLAPASPGGHFCWGDEARLLDVLTVGRDDACDLHVLHPSFKNKHFDVTFADGKFTLQVADGAVLTRDGNPIKKIVLGDVTNLACAECTVELRVSGPRCALWITEPPALAAGPMLPSKTTAFNVSSEPKQAAAPSTPGKKTKNKGGLMALVIVFVIVIGMTIAAAGGLAYLVVSGTVDLSVLSGSTTPSEEEKSEESGESEDDEDSDDSKSKPSRAEDDEEPASDDN